jgi:hypothetical protein
MSQTSGVMMWKGGWLRVISLQWEKQSRIALFAALEGVYSAPVYVLSRHRISEAVFKTS